MGYYLCEPFSLFYFLRYKCRVEYGYRQGAGIPGIDYAWVYHELSPEKRTTAPTDLDVYAIFFGDTYIERRRYVYYAEGPYPCIL